MKKIITLAAIAGIAISVVATSQNSNQKADTYKVNTAASTFRWDAKKVTGAHWGYVKFSDGFITVNGKTATGGTFNVDMNTIDCQDLQGEYNGKLIGHLKSDDFFSVANYKTATLKITSLSPIKDAKTGSPNYNVVADLTIKGKTAPVKFDAQIFTAGNKVIANATFDIDRTVYDIKYGSGKFFEGLGDKAIDDTFKVTVRVEASK
ncbi:MAG: YceI family protein [Bacteroidia bacterium]|jgi:polyisoprenoid-binding protein YceI|nr:YceI family protein [Bacteroidia bacterium]